MSIVEKGIDHAFVLQRRLVWKPEAGLVLGAGPIGLLAASVLSARGLRTVVASREDPADRRAQVVRELGAEYVSTLNCTLRRRGERDWRSRHPRRGDRQGGSCSTRCRSWAPTVCCAC